MVMGTKTWKIIEFLAQCRGLQLGLGIIIGCLIEWSNKENRDVFVEMIGPALSLHTIYLLSTIFGFILIIDGSSDFLKWVWDTPNPSSTVERKKREKSMGR